MNCPQLLNPRAWRSALCSRTAVSNSPRGNKSNICAKMLHTRFMVESPCLRFVLGLNYSQTSRGSTNPAQEANLEWCWNFITLDPTSACSACWRSPPGAYTHKRILIPDLAIEVLPLGLGPPQLLMHSLRHVEILIHCSRPELNLQDFALAFVAHRFYRR